MQRRHAIRKFSIPERLKSIRFAIEGINSFFNSEHNAIVHLLATIAVILVSITLRLTTSEWLFVVSSVAMVWITELLNTAIEKAMDLISTETRKEIRFIKDVAAAAVLIASLNAIVTACFIFIPKFI
jgi:diacylglycerol kinase (ATP)